MTQTRVKIKGRQPEISFNSPETEAYIKACCPQVMDELVYRINDGRNKFGLPPVLDVVFSAYRLKSEVHVLAEYDGGRLEKSIGEAAFKGKLRAKPSIVRAAQSRVRSVTNETVKTVNPATHSRWKNQPPPEQCRSRVIESSQSMNRPSVAVPPVKPIGYEVKTETQPLEEALTEDEYKILAIYVWGRVQGHGHPSAINFSDGGGSGDKSGRLPYSEIQELLNKWCGYIDSKLAAQHKKVLSQIINACISDRQLDIHKVGRQITSSDDIAQQIGGYKGYLKAISQSILAHDTFKMITVYRRLNEITSDDSALSA